MVKAGFGLLRPEELQGKAFESWLAPGSALPAAAASAAPKIPSETPKGWRAPRPMLRFQVCILPPPHPFCLR